MSVNKLLGKMFHDLGTQIESFGSQDNLKLLERVPALFDYVKTVSNEINSLSVKVNDLVTKVSELDARTSHLKNKD